MKTDLHVHSTYSDGTDTPVELIAKAKKQGVKFLSITDHDNIENVIENQQLAKAQEINSVSGVELSIVYSHPLYQDGKKTFELHILGYGFDPENTPFNSELQKNKEYRKWRSSEIFKKVNKALEKDSITQIAEEEYSILEKSSKGSIGRPQIAQLLIKNSIVNSTQEAFERYLYSCDIPKRELTLKRASELIKNAGGFAVLAHPYSSSGHSLEKVSEDICVHLGMIGDMVNHLDGLECFYWENSPKLNWHCVAIAKELKLAVTGGTDHHGKKMGKDRIGKLQIPDYVPKQKIFKW